MCCVVGHGSRCTSAWMPTCPTMSRTRFQLDRWNLALVETHAPYLRRERFVMVTVKPVGEVPITWPEPDAIDRAVRHRPWPPAAYASGNQDWVNYLHQAY